MGGDGARSTVATDWADRSALIASAACLVHCLALPLAVAILPTLSSFLSVPESFHRWILALAVPTAAFALLDGRRRHRTSGPLLWGTAGLALLTLAAFGLDRPPWETIVTVAGSLALAGAHLANWRRRRDCC